MKKTLVLAGALSAVAMSTALVANADTQKTYDFSGFDELDIAAGVEVVYTAGTDYSVVADFRKGGPDDMKIRKDGGRLYISKKATSGWGDKLRVTVKITAPDLNAIEASSGSSIRATGIESDTFALKVSSGASADLSGTCGTMTVKASSGGSADAKDLKCKNVTAGASSGGSAQAYASDSATSNTSSGGSVDIWGKPSDRTANKSVSGGSTSFH